MVAVLLASCSSQPGSEGAKAPSSGSSPNTSTAAPAQSSSGVNPAAIPVGDGRVSTSPEVGYVDSCVTHFTGRSVTGPWLNTAAGTWDSLTKPSSAGSVTWPNATYRVTVSGDTRVITTDDLPVDHPTGTFPIATTDPAYQFDHNPNSIRPHPTTIHLALDPTAASSPGCLRLGAIGILDDGVFLFDALDAAGHDAGAHEILDRWGEHPQQNGVLHHHFAPSFILDQVSHAPGASTLVGYAADGYGIYAEYGSGGHLLTNADLDACHGRTSEVMWNGSEQDVYHYDVTLEYPYFVGCFHGTPVSRGAGGNGA